MSRVGALLLAKFSAVVPNPQNPRIKRLSAIPGSPEYDDSYARDQFDQRVAHGVGLAGHLPSLVGRDVLELGCGHGGISCYLALLGARVVGIDLNQNSLGCGRRLADQISVEIGHSLSLEFRIGDAHAPPVAPSSIDVVFADNLFEHVDDPQLVLRSAFAALRPGGYVIIPTFSSIHSKWGLHLKHALHVPWANAVFSESSIVEAVKLRAKVDPNLRRIYPGLASDPRAVRDLRKHKDLNDITYRAFSRMVRDEHFELVHLEIHRTLLGRIVHRAPALPRARFDEYLSTGAGAVLRRPSE